MATFRAARSRSPSSNSVRFLATDHVWHGIRVNAMVCTVSEWIPLRLLRLSGFPRLNPLAKFWNLPNHHGEYKKDCSHYRRKQGTRLRDGAAAREGWRHRGAGGARSPKG